MTARLLLRIITAAFLLAACGPDETPALTATASSQPERPRSAATLAALEVTSSRYPQGALHPHEFKPGEQIVMNVVLASAAAGTPVKVVWYAASGTAAETSVKKLAPGATTLSFNAPDTTSWSRGVYRAEIWIGDEKVAHTAYVLL